MKKYLLLILLPFFFIKISSQTYNYTVTVQIDNSLQYAYDAAYYKAVGDSYKRSNAQHNKEAADNYFKSLQAIAVMFNENNWYDADIENELLRLKKYGISILDLMPLINNDTLTPEKVRYTLQTAKDELNYSIENSNGNINKLMKKNIVIQQLRLESGENLLFMLRNKTDDSLETLVSKCKNIVADAHECLVWHLSKIMLK